MSGGEGYSLDDISLGYAPVHPRVAVLAKDGIELPVWVLLCCHRDLDTSDTFVGLGTIAGLLEVHRNTVGLAVKGLLKKGLLIDRGRQKQGHGGKWDPRVLTAAIDGEPIKLSVKADDRAQVRAPSVVHGEGDNRAQDRAHNRAQVRASKIGHDREVSKGIQKDQKTLRENLETGHPNPDVTEPQEKTSRDAGYEQEPGPQVPEPKPSLQSLSSPAERAEAAWRDLVAEDPNGPLLEKLAANAASKNKSGTQSATARWNQIGQPYATLVKGEHSPEAVRYAVMETVRQGAVNIAYAAKVLKNNPTGKPTRKGRTNKNLYEKIERTREQKIKYWGTYEDGEGNLVKSVPEDLLDEVLEWRLADGRSIPGDDEEGERELTDEEIERRWEMSPF